MDVDLTGWKDHDLRSYIRPQSQVNQGITHQEELLAEETVPPQHSTTSQDNTQLRSGMTSTDTSEHEDCFTTVHSTLRMPGEIPEYLRANRPVINQNSASNYTIPSTQTTGIIQEARFKNDEAPSSPTNREQRNTLFEPYENSIFLPLALN